MSDTLRIKTCETCRYRTWCNLHKDACKEWQEDSSIELTAEQDIAFTGLGQSYQGKALERMLVRTLQLIDAIYDGPVHVQVNIQRKRAERR